MDATFILKDVIYIVIGVASALGFYWKMVMSDRSQEDKIKQMRKIIMSEYHSLQTFSNFKLFSACLPMQIKVQMQK